MSEPVKCAKCGAGAMLYPSGEECRVECLCVESVTVIADTEEIAVSAWNRLNTPAVDWEKMREQFFLECTDSSYATPNPPRVKVSPSDVFEWFRQRIKGE